MIQYSSNKNLWFGEALWCRMHDRHRVQLLNPVPDTVQETVSAARGSGILLIPYKLRMLFLATCLKMGSCWRWQAGGAEFAIG